jgi:hypothetical protein
MAMEPPINPGPKMVILLAGAVLSGSVGALKIGRSGNEEDFARVRILHLGTGRKTPDIDIACRRGMRTGDKARFARDWCAIREIARSGDRNRGWCWEGVGGAGPKCVGHHVIGVGH